MRPSRFLAAVAAVAAAASAAPLLRPSTAIFDHPPVRPSSSVQSRRHAGSPYFRPSGDASILAQPLVRPASVPARPPVRSFGHSLNQVSGPVVVNVATMPPATSAAVGVQPATPAPVANGGGGGIVAGSGEGGSSSPSTSDEESTKIAGLAVWAFALVVLFSVIAGLILCALCFLLIKSCTGGGPALKSYTFCRSAFTSSKGTSASKSLGGVVYGGSGGGESERYTSEEMDIVDESERLGTEFGGGGFYRPETPRTSTKKTTTYRESTPRQPSMREPSMREPSMREPSTRYTSESASSEHRAIIVKKKHCRKHCRKHHGHHHHRGHVHVHHPKPTHRSTHGHGKCHYKYTCHCCKCQGRHTTTVVSGSSRSGMPPPAPKRMKKKCCPCRNCKGGGTIRIKVVTTE